MKVSKFSRFAITAVLAAALVACGGGGGGGSTVAAPPTVAIVAPVPNCQVSMASGGTTLCANEILVDGRSYTGNPLFASKVVDFTSDGNVDIVISSSTNEKVDPTNPANATPVTFLKGTNSPTAFTSWTPNITGGTAAAFMIRDIFIGDFGNGRQSFYLEDATEYISAATVDPSNQAGARQYVYINDGAGNFTKKDLGVGTVTSHGAATGDPVDGFSVAVNSPWNGGNNGNQIYSTVKIDGNGNVLPPSFVAPTGANVNNGACFYSVAIHIDKPGRSQPAKRDLICFSQFNVAAGLVDNHAIWYNDGAGHFSQANSDPLPNSHSNPNLTGWSVEDVVVGNFSGHTDGREDFAVMMVDRTSPAARTNSNVKPNTILTTATRVFINNGGTFTDQTAQYFGAGCTNCLSDFTSDPTGWRRIYALDVNNDGRSDLVFMRNVSGSITAPQYQFEVLTNTGNTFNRKTFAAPGGGTWLGYGMTAFTLPNGKAQILFNLNIMQNGAPLNRLFIGNFQ